jgi:predicted phage terminase large subunit-like protein
MLLSGKKALDSYSQLLDIINNSTGINPFETTAEKAKRIKKLLANYEAFCEYYFPEYCYAPFSKFHKTIQKNIIDQPNNIFLEQWSRGFAKSTHLGLFLPLFLKFNGKLNGVILGSLNEGMAGAKLDDLQANLQSNQRILNDFGEQYRFGSWEDGEFVTKDGTAFYAFGKKQSPRGYRFKWKRPNLGIVDDLNDTRQLKNPAIADEDKRWVMEELKPALWTRLWWLLIAQNKFHDNTVTALLENDEEFKTIVHRIDIQNSKGESNWIENPDFSNEAIAQLAATEGAGFIRERMNTPFDEGTEFKREWLELWIEPLPFHKYEGVLIHYLDPSYKSTDKSDFKFWVLLGKTGKYYDILRAWGEKTTSKAMWQYAFDTNEWVGERMTVKHCMEANFIQEEVHRKELDRLEEERGENLRCHMDKRPKGDKGERVSSLQPLFERGLVRFNAKEKASPGMKLLRSQLLGFEKGGKINDDGPDALEGAIWMIDKYNYESKPKPRGGKYKRNNQRAI